MWLHLKKDDETTRFVHNRGTATFGQLKDQLSQVSNIPRDLLTVSFGTPPTKVDYPDDTLLLQTPFYDGSQICVSARASNYQPHLPSMLPAATSISGHSIHDNYLHPEHTHPHAHHQHIIPPNAPLPPHLQPQPLQPPQPQQQYIDNAIADGGREGIWIPFKDGYLVRRTVPSDNSCLFTSLALCLGYPGLSPQKLRQIVCECIHEYPDMFNEAVLNMKTDVYCNWIMQPSSWGGGIEMAAISQRFHVEICSIDIQTLRIDRFGEGKYARRVLLLYSGTHYDYVAQVASIGDPRDFDRTEFETGFTCDDDDALLTAATRLAGKQHNQHGFVSDAQVELKCSKCGIYVRGEHGAKQHALVTKHANFVQI